MSKLNRLVFITTLVGILPWAITVARGQALLYTMAADTSVPPLYLGQPPLVSTSYLWFDELMRSQHENAIESYVKGISWNDTGKTLASYLYQVQDDNPLSYYNWDGYGISPNPYIASPGQAEYAFIKQVTHLSSVSGVLLSSLIIADVTITDTVCKKSITSFSTTDQVLVNCVINDEIKGKWIPACPDYFRTKSGKTSSLSDTTLVFPVVPDSASTGTCLQFNYSPEWPSRPGDDTHSTSLKDSAGGWWIKPGKEYIVFLYFVGISSDGSNAVFSTFPVSFGHEGGMYPVIKGIVQDPKDDFSFGSTGLSLSTWKSDLRAKINTLIYP